MSVYPTTTYRSLLSAVCFALIMHMRRQVRLVLRPLAWMTLACALAQPAAAQTHPCDQPTVANPTVQSTSVWFGLCFPAVDESGGSTIFVSFKLVIDGMTVFNGPLPQSGGMTPGGWKYYETPKITLKQGSHTAVAYGSDVEGKPPIASSDPYPFRVKPGGPKLAPSKQDAEW